MSQYCIPLNLDLFPLKNSVNLGALYNNAYSSLEHDQLNPRLVDLLKSAGLEVTLVEIFCRRPSKQTGIHTDGAGGDYVKINWVLGGAGSTMEWYQLRPRHQKPVTTNTAGNADCIKYTADEVNCVYSEEIESPSLVQVGVPHDVRAKAGIRLCISLVLRTTNGNNRISMDLAKVLLANYIGRP